MGLQYVVAKRIFGFDKDKNVKYVAKSVGAVSYTHLNPDWSARPNPDLVVDGNAYTLTFPDACLLYTSRCV